MELKIFLLSRIPRLLAILCTGIGMSVAGLIMQQLCMNKFVSPSTGATIPVGTVWHFAVAGIYPSNRLMGQSASRLCDVDSRHLDFRMVCPENPVQKHSSCAAYRHYVR